MKTFQQSWLSLCEKIQLDGQEQWRELVSAYSNTNLAYHNLSHIEDCLHHFWRHSNLADDPLTVELAIWFHDVVYDPRAKDNEERSAELAAKFLSGTLLAEPVDKLIMATAHTQLPCDQDAKLICDIDLSILGSLPSRYQAYAKTIRQEYDWVPDHDYTEGRKRVLENFLHRPTIFSLPKFQELFEDLARENLQREIKDLETQG